MRVAYRFLLRGLAAGLLVAGLVTSRGEDAKPDAAAAELRDGFETAGTGWEREYADTTVRLLVHDRSDRAAHGGRRSEHFAFEAGAGSQFFVSYALPKVPVTRDLAVSLHVRSNRAGVQIFGRIVLPADVDPETKAPSFVLVPGPVYGRVDRWEKLELVDILPAVERQVRVLRASTRRPVSLEGAYLERVVVNLLGASGASEVFLDDLDVTPVPPELAANWSPPGSPAGAVQGEQARRPAAAAGEASLPRIRLSSYVLEKLAADRRYVGWFPTAIDAPGASVTELRRAGFDVLVTDAKPDPRFIESAVQRRFLLMPRLNGATEKDGPERIVDQMAAYPQREHVAVWHLGDRLGRPRELAPRKEQLDRIRAVMSAMRGTDENGSHFATATVEGELRLFGLAPSNLDILGIQPRIWGTSQSFLDGLAYLGQRRAILVRSNPRAPLWAWIPTSPAPEVSRNIWGDDTPPSWGTPVVLPEQLRLMTYAALSAGYRGLAYLGDADLTRPAGRANLIELGFLNAEVDICEEILAQNVKRIPIYDVFDPEPLDRPTTANVNQRKMPQVKELPPKPGLKAAAISLEGHKGALLLVADFADGAQWQPAQLAYHNLTIYPRLPQNAQVLEISPAEARFLERKTDDRVPGGTRITLPDFGTTTMLLCTTDMAMCQRIQEAVQQIRVLAVQLAIEQAEIQYRSVREVHERLKADGHDIRTETDLKQRRKAGIDVKPPDAEDLLKQSEEFIKNAREAQERQDYSWAWSEARRASRPLRIVMYGHWAQALSELQKSVSDSVNPKPPPAVAGNPKPKMPRTPPLLTSAVSAPPVTSFFTLPELYIWTDWIKEPAGYRFGSNRVPSGSFDDPEAMTKAGWVNLSYQFDGIVSTISTAPRREPDTKKKEPNAAPEDLERAQQEEALNKGLVIKLSVKPERKVDLDTILPPVLDFPVAAIRSPAIRVQANNLVRISVLVKRSVASEPGVGGIIVRDSIGGEAFQYRSSAVIPEYSRVVLYRKAPSDGTFTVTLGMAGYDDAYFDDFRVEVIEEASRYADPGLAQGRRRATVQPRMPDPRIPVDSATRPLDSRRQQR
jgi:hypothetical protein